MPLQNRALPSGEIVASPARGLFTGNRGILPLKNGRLGTSRWSHKHWIICTLHHPKGRYQGPQPIRSWTPLFFLDEAVALAAGHRPCAYCRRDAYRAYQLAWVRAFGAPANHALIDNALHDARVTRTRQQIRYRADCAHLPDHAFVLWHGEPHMIRGERLLPYAPAGYGDPVPRPSGIITILTPRPNVDVLVGGYQPVVHQSASG